MPKEPKLLDVRPLLARGIEPLGAIIEAKSQLEPGQSLVLRAPFEPVPLFGLFENEGDRIEVKKHAGDDWEIEITPSSTNGAGEHHIDLRNMEDSAHLQKTVEAVQALGRDERLLLHSRTEPREI
ncbi:MAG TPA: DUF2249 domain-containing protein, partial [Opitutales bacterium]|nr:DUF2249 domain-containing protein [Opitutales bacterium]